MIWHPVRFVAPIAAAVTLQETGCSADPSTTGESQLRPPSPASETPATSAGATSLKDTYGDITPGKHLVPLLNDDTTYPVQALVDVPDGFITPGGYVVENGRNGLRYGDLMFIADVQTTTTEPCRSEGRQNRPGPQARDLADALATQVPRRSSRPRPVTVDGHSGWYVQITAPRHLTRCAGGRYTLWGGTAAPQETGYGTNLPGTVHHLWILDVDGQRVVVAVRVVPGHTTHLDDLLHMAETTEFAANPEARP